MPDGVLAVFPLAEDAGHREGHQPLRREGQVERERGRVVQRLRQVVQERENADATCGPIFKIFSPKNLAKIFAFFCLNYC
jgi:hypothetical protein